MKFLALIYGDEDRWEEFSEAEQAAVYERYTAFADAARDKGQLAGGGELAHSSTATTVRVRDGETLVTDGPFVETKEALAGFFVFECDTLDDALDAAAQIPGAQHGAIEVRPCYVGEAAEQGAESQEVTA
jgi:hypothetical protein